MLLVSFGIVSTSAQTLNDFIDEVRGDTLVVKNLIDMEGEYNSLINAIQYDTDAPETRVYMLKRGTGAIPSLYLQDVGNNNPFIAPTRPLTIVGPYVGPMVQGTAEQGRPPLIAGGETQDATGITFGFIQIRRPFTLKNLAVQSAASNGEEGWFPFEVGAHGQSVIWDNVLMEHNNWVFINSNTARDTRLHIRNSYFINMTGVATRRNGGVYDSTGQPLAELIVENNTHVQAAGMMYKFRNHRPGRAFINHNTFVNATGQVFTTFGYETNYTVANNLFVNSNIQAYTPGLDRAETDQNNLPHGIINVNHFPNDFARAVPDNERTILVDRNGVYWDPRLEEIVNHLRTNNVPCPPDNDGCPAAGTPTNWMTQMIAMNSRTEEIFNDNNRYPLIHQSNWIMAGDPGFANMPDMVNDLIEWGIATAPGGGDVLLRKLRRAGNEAVTGVADNFINFDWPVAVDLSYSNSTYLSGALAGYPLGDLNWFPAQKAAWEAEAAGLRAELEAALLAGVTPRASGTSIEPIGGELPSTIELDQNYPNPFNPSTSIRFAISTPSQVTLEVFDVTGRRVATLVDRELAQGQYSITWDARNDVGQTVSSGVYLYRLRAGDVVQTKQMTFIK
jgi:hypothetical protein